MSFLNPVTLLGWGDPDLICQAGLKLAPEIFDEILYPNGFKAHAWQFVFVCFQRGEILGKIAI